jgi:hypothetical protein
MSDLVVCTAVQSRLPQSEADWYLEVTIAAAGKVSNSIAETRGITSAGARSPSSRHSDGQKDPKPGPIKTKRNASVHRAVSVGGAPVGGERESPTSALC